MNYFELLYQCYQSGQVAEEQWQKHLQDRKFAVWLRRKLK